MTVVHLASIPHADGDDEEEEDTSGEGGESPDEREAAEAKRHPQWDVRRGVNELENASDNVHYAAAMAALVRSQLLPCTPAEDSFPALGAHSVLKSGERPAEAACRRRQQA